jgi:predicted nucleic acid-binding protein
MIHSPQLTAVLDTNVIYPIESRDIFFWFASFDLYSPKWSQHIFEEWESVMRRKEIPNHEVVKRIQRAHDAFPDALVTNYDSLIDSLSLPDPKDRHVLAAAIKSDANVIVTNNTKDFPSSYLETFGLMVNNPDTFLADTISQNPGLALEAFQALVKNRTSPNLTYVDVLERLGKIGLPNTANSLHSML